MELIYHKELNLSMKKGQQGNRTGFRQVIENKEIIRINL